MSELFDKQVNAQKENLKKYFWVHMSSCKPTKKCAMKMKVETRKNDGCLCWEEGVYKVCRTVQKASVMDTKRFQINDS